MSAVSGTPDLSLNTHTHTHTHIFSHKRQEFMRWSSQWERHTHRCPAC